MMFGFSDCGMVEMACFSLTKSLWISATKASESRNMHFSDAVLSVLMSAVVAERFESLR